MCVQGPQCSRRNVCVSVYVRVCCVLSCVQLFETPWTVALQAPLSMGFPRQGYWSGLPFPPPDLPDPGTEPESPASPAVAGGFFTAAPKYSTANKPTVIPLDWEDPLEKEMASHSIILPWRIPWTEEPKGLQFMGLQRVGHD